MLRSTSGTIKGSTFTLAFAALVIRGVTRARKLLGNRIAVTRLCELDERGLKDIGLTPSDVRAALALPFGRDPSDHLAEVAGHKRARHLERDVASVPIVRLRPRDADVKVAAANACCA
jgi:uncharacterized protein YjiS (DUF1127 family)